MTTIRHIIPHLLLSVLLGCSLFGEIEDETINWDADRFYVEARNKLDSGYYSEAIKLYRKLDARYPFGKYAQQSLVDLAYAHYKSDQPDVALATADRFIKLYPQNSNIDYIYYLKGLINFNRSKGFLTRYLPIDESQRDTLTAFQSFFNFSDLIKRFPNSKYAPDAEKRMRYLRDSLAKYELHVADYYMRRGAYIAAANRARFVIENYSRTTSLSKALVVIAKAYKTLGLEELSADAVRVLKLNFPNHPAIYELENTPHNS